MHTSGDLAKNLSRGLEIYGLVKTKDYLDLTFASCQPSSQPVSSPAQVPVQQVMKLRAGLVTIIKIAAHLMEALETFKQDKEICERLSKIITVLTGMML